MVELSHNFLPGDKGGKTDSRRNGADLAGDLDICPGSMQDALIFHDLQLILTLMSDASTPP